MKRGHPKQAGAPAFKKRMKGEGECCRTNRRGFIAGAVGAAGLFALGAAAGGEATDLVRPPGAADESGMKALCLRCDRCRSVCHAGVIGVGGLAHGFSSCERPS